MRVALVLFLMLTGCGIRQPVAISVLTPFQDRFPTQPDTGLTPGSLCQNPDYERYAEKIPYCNRNVDSSTKREIIREYDSELGYSIGEMDRQDFKIDHFIPLSIGGSNSEDNLWPQHKSVYSLTDKIEDLLHLTLEKSVLKQAEAIEKIRYIKFNLDEAKQMEQELEQLLNDK